MSVEKKFEDLAFESWEVDQAIEGGKLSADFKNQWADFYKVLKSFAATDPATIAANPVFAESEIDKFKTKLETWKNAALAASEAFIKDQSNNSKMPLLIGGGVALLALILLSRRS
jgi:hypothetical protein